MSLMVLSAFHLELRMSDSILCWDVSPGAHVYVYGCLLDLMRLQWKPALSLVCHTCSAPCCH